MICPIMLPWLLRGSATCLAVLPAPGCSKYEGLANVYDARFKLQDPHIRVYRMCKMSVAVNIYMHTTGNVYLMSIQVRVQAERNEYP
jgi:hypothetical protein